MISPAQEKNFLEAREAYLARVKGEQSIGLLNEHALHGIIKRYLSKDLQTHEIPIENHIADVVLESTIFEIQTRSLYKLKKKIADFLKAGYHVCVVYPISSETMINQVDEDFQNPCFVRKSPKKEKPLDALNELYSLKEFLGHPCFSFRIMSFQMQDYKTSKGKRIYRIPSVLLDDLWLQTSKDYEALLPIDLKEPFTASTLCKLAHVQNKKASRIALVLRELGIIRQVGKEGNAYLYSKGDGIDAHL